MLTVGLYGIKDISLYLSSLDLFQSPQLLEQALSLFVDENNKTTNEVLDRSYIL